MEAFREYEASETMEGQISAIDRLGANNVGESIDLVQNVDVAFILGRTVDSKLNERDEIEFGDRYLLFKLIANRGKTPPVKSFRHRFKKENDMSLMEDIHAPTSLSAITSNDFARERAVSGGLKTKGPRSV